jgi:NADH:ubiquinone reductase (non-electrogenic)
MFSQQLMCVSLGRLTCWRALSMRSDYTLATFKRNHIDVLTRTSVKEVAEKHIVAQKGDGSKVEIPYGLLVWATGNTTRLITRDLMKRLGDAQNEKRGLTVNDHVRRSDSH